jgi:hypothetical protein
MLRRLHFGKFPNDKLMKKLPLERRVIIITTVIAAGIKNTTYIFFYRLFVGA